MIKAILSVISLKLVLRSYFIDTFASKFKFRSYCKTYLALLLNFLGKYMIASLFSDYFLINVDQHCPAVRHERNNTYLETNIEYSAHSLVPSP
jgi:hypothetical protein